MVEAKISERAQKILAWLQEQGARELPIRQVSLAEQFTCSRRTIGRALKELKDAGLLVDLNKRHENRCKLYSVIPALPAGRSLGVGGSRDPWIPRQARNDNPLGQQQLKLYRQTFEVNFRDWPDWEKHYTQVTWELRNETNMEVLFRHTFDNLYAIRDAGSMSECT